MRLPPREDGNWEGWFYGTLFALAIVVGMVGAFIEGLKKNEPNPVAVEDKGCALPVYSPVCMSRNVKELIRDQPSAPSPESPKQ